MKHLILLLLCIGHTSAFCATITTGSPQTPEEPQKPSSHRCHGSSSGRVNDMRVPITYTSSELQNKLTQLKLEDKRIIQTHSDEQIYHHAQMRKQELWHYIQPYQEKTNEAIAKTYSLFKQAQTAHPDERDLCYKEIQNLAALIEKYQQAIIDITHYKEPTDQDTYGWLGSYLFGPYETLYIIQECEPNKVTFIKDDVYNSDVTKKTITSSSQHDYNSVNIPWQKPKKSVPSELLLNPQTSPNTASQLTTPPHTSPQPNNQTPPQQPQTQNSPEAPKTDTPVQKSPDLSIPGAKLQALLQPTTPSKDIIQLTPLTKLENKPQINPPPLKFSHFSFNQKPPTARLFSFDLGNHTTVNICPPAPKAPPTPSCTISPAKPTSITFTNSALKGVSITPAHNVTLHNSPLNSIPLPSKNTLSFTQKHPALTNLALQHLIINPLKHYALNKIAEARHNRYCTKLNTLVNTYARSSQPPQNCEKQLIQPETPPFYYFSQESRAAYTQEQKLRNELTNFTIEHKDFLAQRAHDFSICALEYAQQKNDDQYFFYAKRVEGIHDTLMRPGYVSSQHHTLHDAARGMLNRHTINTHEFTNYTGNPLQQVLHSELVDTLNTLGHVEKTYGTKAPQALIFTDAAIEFTHAAKKYNDAGNLDLTDQASHIGQQCLHLAKTYGKAITEGVFEGVENTTNALLHPIQTAQECLQTMRIIAVEVGCMIQRIAPPAPWTIYNNPQAWHTYKTTLSDEVTWWNDTALALYQAYQDAPQGTIVKYAIRTGIEVIANKKISKAFTVLGARAKNGIAESKIFKTLTSPEKLKKAPAATLVTEAHCIQELVSYAQTKNIPAQQVLEGIKNLETHLDINALNIMTEAKKQFKNISGLDDALDLIIKHAHDPQKFSTAKGPLYELKTALKMSQQGEEVIGISQRLGGEFPHPWKPHEILKEVREFDVITKTKVIECKNIRWPDLNDSTKEIMKKAQDLKDQFVKQKRIAESALSKKFELHSAQKIPQEWKDFFVKKGITFIED